MSTPEVKLKKISLLNFRGSKELLDLDLGSQCKSCAIFGNNASGKSTFTQALEWFFRGRIAYLKGEGITDEDIINLASSSEDETNVNLVFNKSELNSSKVYDKTNRRHKYSNNSQLFSDYIENKATYDRLYLDQHTIIWFLTRRKGEKKDEIAKIVGYEEIIKVKSVISSVLHDLERSQQFREIRNRFEENRGLMTKEIYGEAIVNLETLYEKSQEFLKVFGIKDEIKNVDQLEKLINKAFRVLPNQERAKERIELEKLKAKVDELEKKSNFIQGVSDWISSFNILVEDRENVSKLNMDEFLRWGENILKDSPDIDNCPLCEQPIESQEILLQSVIDRYRKLTEIREKLKEYSEKLSDLREELQNIEAVCSEVSTNLEKRQIPYDTQKLKIYSDDIKVTSALLEKQFQDRQPIKIEKEKITYSIKDVGGELSKVRENLSKRISSLAFSKEEEEKLAVYQKLARGKDLVLENIDFKKEIEAFNLLIQNLRSIENQMLLLQNSVMRQVLDLLSSDVNKYFCFLNKKERIKNVRLELKGDEGIEFALEFYDNEASPPRKYLSESQLNSLGIAFFLAAVKKFNKSNKFFVLDDVLVSFDKNYRLRLLDLLEEYFSEYQMFLLTHEEFWYQMMKKKFPNWIFKEVCWDYITGIRFKDTKVDLLLEISDKHSRGEKVGNELRTYIEALLKDICLALEVKLAFRMGIDNERRMIGEMFSALTSTLNEHQCTIQKSSEYRNLEVSNFILTCASHHNPDLDSLGDVGETIEKVHDFRDLFICEKSRFVERRFRVHGQDKISCKCGCLQIHWK